MSGPSKGISKAEVGLKWDPSPLGEPDHDLDLIAATFRAADPTGKPAYLVHFDSRSPDGTITLNRDSRTGQGFGYDEVMVFELDRLAPEYGRVVIGVTIQQRAGRKTFGDVPGTLVRFAEGYDELARDDFSAVAGCTAATVGEFVRVEAGDWSLRFGLRGYEDADPRVYASLIGRDTA
ncbi:TerD family protein [Streptomyces sp. 7-21]|uniref:TerD family protein n=1 Tax=Streptomyces sp. 7-21 TaxID=2802283 RepID=UPI00191CA2B8|nr:TerD family protein [Streptomyces sp. 7-21]MBL1065239.1 TerD family protein [Streptomyces sp. 7-21]